MEKLAEVLARVAEQLGMKASELWPKVVLYHWVVSVIQAVALPVALGVTVAVWWRCFQRVSDSHYDFDEAPMYGVGAVVGGILGIVLVLMFFLNYSFILASVISPEAGLVYKVLGK